MAVWHRLLDRKGAISLDKRFPGERLADQFDDRLGEIGEVPERRSLGGSSKISETRLCRPRPEPIDCIAIFKYGNIIPMQLRDFKAEFFKTLSHTHRIRILDALRDGELTVSDLQDRLKMEQSSVSGHLSVLRARDFVRSRREGTSVYYTVADPAIWQLLDIAKDIYERQLIDNRAMFEALQ